MGREGGHLVQAVEVIHAVHVGDVGLAAEDVDHGNLDVLEFLLLGHRHTRNGRGRIQEQAAVADHDGLEARVGGVVEGLQSTAGHAGRGDGIHVDASVVRAVLVGVLGNGPVDGLKLLGGGRLRSAIRFLFHRDIAGSDHQEALRGDLVEELVVFPGGIGAGAVAPDEHRKQVLLAEGGKVLRGEDGVRFKRRVFEHQHFDGTGAAVFDDQGLGGVRRHRFGRTCSHDQGAGRQKEGNLFHGHRVLVTQK